MQDGSQHELTQTIGTISLVALPSGPGRRSKGTSLIQGDVKRSVANKGDLVAMGTDRLVLEQANEG